MIDSVKKLSENYVKSKLRASLRPHIDQQRTRSKNSEAWLLPDHAVVLGVSQHGKTTSAFELLSEQPDLKLFVNTKLQPEFSKKCRYSIPNSKIDLDEKEQFVHVLENRKEFENDIIEIRPDMRKGKDFINSYAEELIDYHLDNYSDSPRTTIILDEIHVYQSNKGIMPWLARLFNMGLGPGIRCISVAQIPQQLNDEIRSNSQWWILHHLKNKHLKFLDDSGYTEGAQKLSFGGSKYRAYVAKGLGKSFSQLK